MSMMNTIVIASAGVSSAGMFGVYLWSRLARSGAEYSYRRCPGCNQRIRFLTSKTGRGGQCPRCRERFPLESRT